MSKTIDERVVQMRFDNAQFERNVSTSMSTLDKLKQSLNLTGASKGLENINNTAKGINFSGLTNAVDSVKLKFSALQVMAVTALSNITNSAVNAGKRLVSAFTVEPIMSGFQEYETQINAVQTILANTESKGSTLQDVNRALNELNTYADKTIYNFTEMTRNIGTFTAAGVDLKTSVSAIKGIANLAAVSGSTSQQASTAMYQLSQALASGTVKLQDWNSVVNAGMGGQVFQDALKETARVHGVAIDKMIKEEGSFRETLQKGWLTSDILTETLNHFTMAAEEGSAEWEAYKKSLMDTGYSEKQAVAILKLANTATDAATKVKTFSQLMDTLKESAQSGWTKSWEIMIGDFEEAKYFLTDVSDKLGAMIGESADARNKILSGGLSSGWKQLLDAGITDEEGYKETLKSVAKTHGTSIDDMIAAEKKLDDKLTDSEAFQKALKKGFDEGKISSDMMAESVHKMADKMSKMSAKQLEAAGYTAENVTQIKTLSDGLKDGSISMDEFVKKIQRTSGRENIIQALWNAFNGLMSVIKPIKEAFRDIFPPITGEQLYKFTELLQDFTAKLKLSETQSNQLKSTFKGLFAVVDIGWTFIKKLAGGIVKLVGNFKGVGGSILETTASIGDWLVSLRDSIKETDIFGKAIDGVVNFITKAVSKIKEFGSAIGDWVGNLKKTVQESDLWGQRIAKITKFLDKAKEAIKDFFSRFGEKIAAPGLETLVVILGSLWKLVKKVGSVVGKFAKKIGTAFTEAFRSGDLKGGIDLLNGGIFAAILLGIKKFIGGLKDTVGSAGGFLDGIKDVLDGVKGSLEAWQQSLKADTLKKIAVAIAILAGSLLIMSLIDPEKLGASLGGITVLFANLMGSMAVFDKLGGKGGRGVAGAANSIIKVAAAVLILSYALKNISTLSWEELAKGLVGVTVLLGEVVAASILLSKYGNKVKRCGLQMILIAAALKIFVSVCEDLSKLGWEELAKGVSGIGAILLEFVGFQALMKLIKPKKMLSSALALVVIGAAMEIFADVCKKFGQMEWTDLGKAGAAIGGILALASGFALLSGLAKKMLKSSVALVIIGAAMEIFADVCKKFGQMEWGELGKAGAAIGGILVLAAGFMLLAGLSKKMLSSVVALTIISVAMEIFADVCKKFGQMEWEELGKAGAAIGGILALCAGFALLAGLSSGMLKSAAALVVMAVALAMLTPVLKNLGGLSWEEIVKGLVAIAGVFVIIGIAGLVLGPVVPVILALAGAIALLGLACLAVGVGMLAFSVAFTALSTATAAGATAMVAALGVIIVGILDLIPAIIDELTKALVALCQVIIQGAPAIAEAIIAVVLAALDVLVECVPQLASGLLQTLLGILDALVEYAPQIVNGLVDLIISLIDSLSTRLPEFVESMINFLTILFDSISANITPLIESWARLFGAIFQGVADVLGPIVESVFAPILEIIKDLIVGIVEAIAPYIPMICDAFVQMTQIISDAIVQITQAIAPFMPNIQAMVESVSSAIQSICAAFTSLVQNLAPIIDSISNLIGQLGNSITQILLGIATVIRSVADVITQVFQGIANVIIACGDAIRTSLDGIAGIFDSVFGGIADVITSVGDSIRNVLDGIADIIESIGDAALNAGKGFEKLANGVKTITELNLLDMAASMGAVAIAIGKITAHSKGLAESGQGMKQIADGVQVSSTAFNAMAVGITKVTSTIASIGSMSNSAMSMLKASIAGTATCFVSMSTAAASASISVAASIASMASICSSAARNMATSFSAVGHILMTNMAGGIRTGSLHIRTIMISLLTTLVPIAKSRASQFTSIGRTLAVRFASGVKSGSSSARKAFSSTLSAAVASIKNYYGKFYAAGQYVVMGFVNGIDANTYKAEGKAAAMALKAEAAAKAALNAHSPSKKFYKVGTYAGQGFVNALDDFGSQSYKAGFGMAENARTGLSKAISTVRDFIDSGMDDQLTIRPVLDLTDVTAGANRLNSLFDTNPSVGVLSNVRSASSMMNRNQNGANGDIISAIKDLGKTIGSSSGDTYSINGITYDDGSTVSEAVRALTRAVRIEGRA